ncbi:MAG TPA: MarR family transcriptional regulator [Longimicrobium sp.]|nr:MarR family transcriptional regulator [Longimicrobium sp.]
MSYDDPPSRTPAGDAFTALVVQVLRLNGHLTAAGDALARPAGQTSARWQVMGVVEHGPATVAQVARALGLARQSVQRIADLLEGDGLAEFIPNPADRRAALLQLTVAGRAALRTIQTAQRAWADALGAEIGEDALRQASEVLARVAEVVASRGYGER